MAKINVKNKTEWFSHSSFTLGISMGSQNHEGEALEAIINKLNESHFSKGVIDLSDLLNRYRHMANGKSNKEALLIAKKEGDNWLQRNGKTLFKLKVPFTVHRWDEWLTHKDFGASITQAKKMYLESNDLRNSIQKDIRNFSLRTYGTELISKQRQKLSIQYYLEEIAAHNLLLKQEPGLVIYPGKQLESFKAIREGKVANAPETLTNSEYCRLVIHSFEKDIRINENTKKRKA